MGEKERTVAVEILEKLKEALAEYGIHSPEELEAATATFAGINLGIFTAPIPERARAER